MNKKLQVAVLCGGQSAEHEVSILSAKSIVRNLDAKKYDILIIYITKNGEWFLLDSPITLINSDNPQTLLSTHHCQKVSLVFGEDNILMTLTAIPQRFIIDVIFPALHGAHGEDGTLQGLLELVNIPYVGPGVLGSSICMDKEISKILLDAAGIPTARWISLTKQKLANLDIDKTIAELGLPLFVKPANTGSSVGITKVKHRDEFNEAIELALQYDHKILLEEFIAGHEIEIAVLGNETPEVSLPGEIICHHEFYSYEAKYIDPNGASLEIPAKLPAATIIAIQDLAKKAFAALCCEGMARIDFFVTADNKIFINEANTIPGFTQISMYPKMWTVSGMPYAVLLDKLINLALQRFQRNRVLVAKQNPPTADDYQKAVNGI